MTSRTITLNDSECKEVTAALELMIDGLIAPLLLRYIPRDVRRSMNDRWPEWMAPEIFGEHFAQSELRREVVDYFINEPKSSPAAAALAETALRSQEPQLEELLREKASGLEYDIPTAFRVMAVTETADRIPPGTALTVGTSLLTGREALMQRPGFFAMQTATGCRS